MLIQDGAKYHTAAATTEFIAAHADRLSVYQLPSYSPDYNPIEHLWKNMKKRTTHNRYVPEFDLVCASVRSSTWSAPPSRRAWPTSRPTPPRSSASWAPISIRWPPWHPPPSLLLLLKIHSNSRAQAS